MHIDGIHGRRRDVIPRTLLEQSRRDGACGGDPYIRRLLQGRVQRDAVAQVVDVGNQGLILVGLEATVSDFDLPIDDRLGERTGKGGVGGQPPAQPTVLEEQRLELRDVHVAGAHLERTCRLFSLHQDRAADIQRLIGARQPQVLDRQPAVAVLHRCFGARNARPLDPLGAHRELRQMKLLMIGVEDDGASRIERSCPLLKVGRELELLLRVGSRRVERGELDPAQREERRVGGRLHPGIDEVQLGHRRRILAVQIERLVFSVSEAAAVQRTGRLHGRRVSRDCPVERDRARESLLSRELGDLADIRRDDVVLEVRVGRAVERKPA